MKKTSHYLRLTIACALLLSIETQAQNLVEAGNQWNMIVYPSFTPQTISYSVRIGADTIVNSISYNKIDYTHNASGIDWEFSGNYFRQDGQKVYFKKKGLAEVLLYDFGLELYDLFGTDGNCELIVTEIDTVQLKNGELRKRLKLRNFEEPELGEERWIEGIGSNLGVTTQYGLCLTDNSEGLLCFYSNQQLVYPQNPISCFVTAIEELNGDANFKVYPNPLSNTLTIEDEGLKLKNYELYDLLGKMITRGMLGGYQNQIDLESLESGYYMLVLKGRSGDDYSQKVIKM